MFLTLASFTLAELLQGILPEGWQYVGAGVLHMALLFAVFSLCPFFFIWLERKAAGLTDRPLSESMGIRYSLNSNS